MPQHTNPIRMGIFGGSFDPVHLGHLWIAEAAMETLQLSSLRWIPAAQSPLKPDGPVASAEDRYQMVRLAVSGCQHYVVDDREIRRGEVSYTVETLQELRDEWPDAELFLIMGSDSLASIGQWYQPRRLLSLAQLAVVQRGGEPDIDFGVLEEFVEEATLKRIASQTIRMPVIEISSSEMRSRVAAGRSIRYRTPRAVEALIQQRALYQTTASGA